MTLSTIWPNVSRFAQRATLAAQSAARTGVPSWNCRPGRRRTVKVRPSSDTWCPSAICGFGTDLASAENSVS